jgi:DNA helicase-2/ATP-dependent DNA helicase PcrA
MNTGGNQESSIPTLEGPAAQAVLHRGSHIQIIACAGAGKTETVSQRVARLVAEGVEPAKIVAFTFTEKAAAELKERIRARVEAAASKELADRLGNMYVGTIHGFCFQLLSKYDGRFESFDVLDQQQMAAFLHRVNRDLELKQFSEKGKLFEGLKNFASNIDVMENELLDVELMPEPFKTAAKIYYEFLDRHRLLTFGQQIAQAVVLLENETMRNRITDDIEHLIVDEYQDVNPAQERLIELMSKPIGKADLVVVGDDDQAIYQWRGSKVENIISFTSRYSDVTTFELLKNRRSRPQIVKAAEKFASSIPNRLSKDMRSDREHFGPALDLCYDFDDEEQEAMQLALTIKKLRTAGYPYSAMAVLVRGKAAYPAIMKAFEEIGIPVQPGGRTGLFGQPDADFLGKIFAWFAGDSWREGIYSSKQIEVSLKTLKTQAQSLYQLSAAQLSALEKLLTGIKNQVGTDSRKISLIRNTYDILDCLGIKNWSDEDPLLNARRGTIARFLKLIADYEGVQMRARFDEETGAQVSASDQKEWYYKTLSILIANYAQGQYDDFEGEEGLESDAVELTTVHSAKGLEWPIVFLPSLTKNRFPSSKSGRAGKWFVPTELFDKNRYEGGDADERRLFYVALTRARDWVSLSAHKAVTTKAVKPSEYILEIESFHKEELSHPEIDGTFGKIDEVGDLQITYSEIADYLNCGYAYWLRNKLGFPPELVAEIGYGKAVHHLMRAIAEFSQEKGRKLTPVDVDKILATEFFLPFAGKTLASRLRDSARKLVFQYVTEYEGELDKTWATERPFELALPGVVVSGRADVVINNQDGTSLSIMDYKTGISAEDPSLQLQIYTEAGRREGLEVTGAYIHDLSKEERITVDLSDTSLAAAREKVISAAVNIKERKFEAKPEVSRCSSCDVRFLCSKNAKK